MTLFSSSLDVAHAACAGRHTAAGSRQPRSGARLRLLLLVACTLGACRGSGSDAAAEQSPGVLPSMMPAQATNADASPPEVPFSAATPRTVARARASWPHDTAAYTQGLLLHDGHLIESTGREGQSDIREVERGSGRVVRRTRLPRTEFGEGAAVAGDRVYQLTWKGGRGHAYDARTLASVDSFTYDGEGWGLAANNGTLVMSDGSSSIRTIDPHGFREVGRTEVREGDKPVWMLNELELVGGELWANVYETDFIARIVPSTGRVVGWIDLGRLLTSREHADVVRRGGVANGIAYDPLRKVVIVTGKLWPRMFELDLRDIPAVAAPAR